MGLAQQGLCTYLSLCALKNRETKYSSLYRKKSTVKKLQTYVEYFAEVKMYTYTLYSFIFSPFYPYPQTLPYTSNFPPGQLNFKAKF